MLYLRRFLGVILLFAIHSSVFAVSHPIYHPEIAIESWFTGPLLAPAGITIPPKHINIEPYLFAVNNYAYYQSNGQVLRTPRFENISPVMIITQGLLKDVDVQVNIPYEINNIRNQWGYGIGDVTFLFGFQAIRSDVWPSLRVTVGEILPVGRYDNLIAGKLTTDATGAGSFQTALAANFQKAFIFFNGRRFLRTRLSLNYIIPSTANINNISAYGGGFNTNGRIHFDNRFIGDLAFEYTLTRNWVPAMDIVYSRGGVTSFIGNPGVTSTGTVPVITALFTPSWSLAPALEYNFNAKVGVIAGTWFTVSGHNPTGFNSAVVAVNYYN